MNDKNIFRLCQKEYSPLIVTKLLSTGTISAKIEKEALYMDRKEPYTALLASRPWRRTTDFRMIIIVANNYLFF